MISVNDVKVVPTIFPDQTSQVWKLDPVKYFHQAVTIEWDFESESELMHVLQLVTLIRHNVPDAHLILKLSYLPYARQDKDISNETTFALHTFFGLMAMAFDHITVFDPHSTHLLDQYFGESYTVIEPELEILQAMNGCEGCYPDTICYPDKGASTRYPFLNAMDSVHMEKTRIQSTGEITGVELHGEVKDKRVLIVDDLCDGGRTFIEAAKVLYAAGALEVHLYVSHGIFSAGLWPLHQGGIMKIYTRKGFISDINQKYETTNY